MWPDSSHVGEPRRIWGQRRCPAELVGLAFVAAIQLDSATSSERTNRLLPPRLLNQQKPRHCSSRFQEKSTSNLKGPSIFTISSPSSSCPKSSSSSSHFSTSCFLCKRPLSSNKDIYMYRGDQAFCTKQCRYHQMVVDESKEKMCLRAPTITPAKCHIDYYRHKEGSFACA